MRKALPLLLLLAGTATGGGCGLEEDPRPASLRYIQATILEPSCATAACHSSQNQRANRVFDDPDTILEEVYGTGVQPGDPADSRLITFYLTGDGDLRMPLDAPLPDADIALISRWILEGAEDN